MNVKSRLKMMRAIQLAVSCVVVMVATLGQVQAGLIANGDFSNGHSGWDSINSGVTIDSDTIFELGSPGGPTDPVAVNGESFSPASRVLYQDFVVPEGITTASFRFDFFSVENEDPLDSTSVNHVQGISGTSSDAGPNIFRIDLVDPSPSVFTTPSLFELYADPGGIHGSPTELVTQTFGDSAALADFLSSNAGNTLRLRIGQAESGFPWYTGVDNIDLDYNGGGAGGEPIPEPGKASRGVTPQIETDTDTGESFSVLGT